MLDGTVDSLYKELTDYVFYHGTMRLAMKKINGLLNKNLKSEAVFLQCESMILRLRKKKIFGLI